LNRICYLLITLPLDKKPIKEVIIRMIESMIVLKFKQITISRIIKGQQVQREMIIEEVLSMFRFQINTQTTILHRAEVEIFHIFHLNNRLKDIQVSLHRKLYNQ
jgi:hypothetical protein